MYGADGAVLVPARMTYEEATRHLATELARKYKLAYYEGRDGTFTRVQPP